MKYTSQENKIIEKIKQAIPDVTPGVSARAYHMGRLVCDINVGDVYPYYDLASLTKVIFTGQAMLEAFDRGLWTLDTKVKDILTDAGIHKPETYWRLTAIERILGDEYKPWIETMGKRVLR